MNDLLIFYIGCVLTVIFIGLSFLVRWRISRMKDFRTLRLGRYYFIYLVFVWIALNGILGSFIVYNPDDQSGLIILIFEMGAITIIPVLAGIFIPFAIIVLSVKMWQRESKSIGNLLLPIVVLAFLLISILYHFVDTVSTEHTWLQILSWIYPVLTIYLGWQFGLFYLSSWFYGRRVKKINTKYHVVLGAGLIDGYRVGKLLGNRIKAAVKAAGPETIILFSGGQGPDEKVPEAVAMRDYAVSELGFPLDRTMIEDQSRTTYENLVFSDEILKEDFLFFSSDYHVFRAALFARNIGLTAQGGRGGKTAMYYRVPAFMREFIAVMNYEKKKHIVRVGLIVACFSLLALLIAMV